MQGNLRKAIGDQTKGLFIATASLQQQAVTAFPKRQEEPRKRKLLPWNSLSPQK